MHALLKVSRIIDVINERLNGLLIWLVLAMTLISAGNALVRKIFDTSSNAMLELQWYLFSAIFLLAAGHVLQKNAHVRIDVIAGRLSRRTQVWIEVCGGVFFLLPMCLMITWLSWGVFVGAFESGEMSGNAGGLIIWPARLMVPVGFGLLILQALSELIKRAAFLRGQGPDPLSLLAHRDAEAELAEAIRKQRGLQDGGAGS